MKLSTLAYSIKQGFKNIKRNRLFSLASIGTITASLFLFGVFFFIAANLRYTIKQAETTVGVTVFFDEGISQEQIDKIGIELDERPEVSRTEFLSAEDTWENYKKKYQSSELAETFGDDNPLANSASYSVYLNDVSKQNELVNYIKTLDGVRKVNSSEAVAVGLTGVNSLVTYITSAIIIILLAVAIFLISTTVSTGIAVRKEEIHIMKFIGATDFFIRAPFIVEGVVIGFLGSLLPLFVLYLLYGKIVQYISERFISSFGTMRFLSVGQLFSTLIPVSLLIGIGIGFIGSFVTVRRHLKV